MDLDTLAEKVGQALLNKHLMLTTAESCTGGWVAEVITRISGSSGWFDRGFVTYTNEAKHEMLGVKAKTLRQYGAVSEETVIEMAEGALKHSRAQIALAISGIAGPTGGTADKPVGTVCFAWAGNEFSTHAKTVRFFGDRKQVRSQSVEYVLMQLLEQLTQQS